jgi:hypothetical protein
VSALPPPPPPPPYGPVPQPPPIRRGMHRAWLAVLVALACIAGVVFTLMMNEAQSNRERRECDRIEARGGECE